MLLRNHPSVLFGCLAWTCLFLFLFTPLHAQWSEEDGGVLISTGVHLLYHILPDGEGGAWIAYDRHTVYTSGTFLQRIDNDGVKQFGDEYGISIGPGNRNVYLGLLPADSGAVWVTYINDTTDPDNGYSVYAQKVNLDGSFAFDSTGVLVVNERSDQRESYNINPLICSDGAGGFWHVYRLYDFSLDMGLAVAGLNADGTPKVAHSVVLYENYFSESQQVGLCEDEAGGVWVVWEDPDNHDQTRCQRVSAGGEQMFDESAIIYSLHPGLYTGRYSCIPDGFNGFFLSFQSEDAVVCFQHVLADRTIPWGDRGVIANIRGESTSSEILRMPDSTLAVTTVGAPYNAYLVRMYPDSSAYYDSLAIIVNRESYRPNAYAIYSPSVCCSDGAGGIFGFYGWNNDDFDAEGIRVHRINNDGELYWGNDSIFVVYDLLRHPSIGRTKCVSIPERHEAIVSVFKGRGGAGELWFYKVTGDGRVAGRDTVAVAQDIPASLPEDFRILSAWPNPFNSSTLVQIALTVQGEYSFHVYDRLGRQVLSEERWLPAGYSTWDWTPSGSLASGVYFLQVHSPQGVSESQPLFLLK